MQSQRPLILGLDDEPFFVKAVNKIVTGAFPHCECVTTMLWSEIDSQLRENKNRTVVLISDINMPTISGGQFCSIIKRSYPKTRIIFFSAAEVDVPEFLKTTGAAAFVQKRGGPNSLIEAIRQALG